jgi:hypothetical protein
MFLSTDETKIWFNISKCMGTKNKTWLLMFWTTKLLMMPLVYAEKLQLNSTLNSVRSAIYQYVLVTYTGTTFSGARLKLEPRHVR